MRALFASLCAAITLSACWRSASDEALDAFIAINDSLEVTKGAIDKHRSKLPPIPFADLGCPEFQALSDSMAMALASVEQAMTPLLNDLAGVPQDDLEAGDKSFMNAHQGEALFAAIANAYDIASDVAPDDSTRTRISDTRSSAFPRSTPEAWRAAYFTDAPRGAVVTVLSKMRRDIEELRGMCDNALLKACLDRN